jgi:hypothetical protein
MDRDDELWYARRTLVFQGVSAVATVLALVSLVWLVLQTKEMKEQSELLGASVDNSVYQALADQRFELDKLFIANPELRPHFYDSWGYKQVSDDPDLVRQDKLFAIAEFKLDYFDAYLRHRQTLTPVGETAGGKANAFDEKAFDHYLEYSFRHSSLLCEMLQAQSFRYSTALKDKVEKLGACGSSK